MATRIPDQLDQVFILSLATQYMVIFAPCCFLASWYLAKPFHLYNVYEPTFQAATCFLLQLLLEKDHSFQQETRKSYNGMVALGDFPVLC